MLKIRCIANGLISRNILGLLVISQLLINISVAQTPEPVVWADLENATVQADNSLLRISSSGYGTTGAASEQKLVGDGSISFDLTDFGDGQKHHYVIGLSESNSDAHYRSIDYGIVVYSPNKVILVYENNNLRETRIGYSFFVPGKTFTIERQGSTISYFHDGSLIHESKSAFTGELLVDVAMGPQGDMIPNVMITGAGGSNTPPEITSIPATSVFEGTLYSYEVTATDPDGDVVTLTATLIPGWLSFDGVTLSGTPTNADVGPYNVEIVATDSAGATSTQTFTIQVNAINGSGPQEFPFGVTVGNNENSANLSVYGNSNLGQVILDVMGGDLGPADNVDYGTAPFLIMHDDLKMALDGDQLSSDATPLVIQNTNPAGGIVFRTGASTEDRLVIDSNGNVTLASPAGDISMGNFVGN